MLIRAYKGLLGVQGLVEAAPGPRTRDGLDPAGEGVAAVEQSGGTGEIARLDHLLTAVGHEGQLGAGGQVQPGLDDAVVAERDADAGIRAEQTPAADGDLLLTAAGQRAHDRRAAADVATVADDDALRDPALDHRGAQRAGVVVAETLVHDGRA